MKKKPTSQEIIDFLTKTWNNKNCFICGGNEWSVNDKVYELREFNEGNLVLGGRASITPVIPVVCEKCGNTVFINALITGLLKE